ncbi:MAG: hypothetical protein C0616_06885 [Desulfuromonas sp.]|nr:MAG: hypothetical protein C0616_06885 [Desulfuromonas sp.]
MAFIIFLLLLVFACPVEAHAWGIGFHLHVGSQLLEHIGQFAPHLEAILKAQPYDYLYGCISADITIGKKFTHYLEHCHSWRIARKLIKAAKDDRQKACAYGYLSHLAMDTIAHSYFVPFKTIRSFNTVMLKHAYWEMRIEAEIPAATWTLARNLARKNYQHNDAMLRSIVADTIFSFGTNKRLFNSLLLLNRLQHWQKILRSINRASRWTIDGEDIDEYFTLSYEAAASILADMERSPYWRADPAGERALGAASEIRKSLNLLWLDGKLTEQEADRLIAELKPRLKEGITDPDHLLDLLSAG